MVFCQSWINYLNMRVYNPPPSAHARAPATSQRRTLFPRHEDARLGKLRQDAQGVGRRHGEVSVNLVLSLVVFYLLFEQPVLSRGYSTIQKYKNLVLFNIIGGGDDKQQSLGCYYYILAT